MVKDYDTVLKNIAKDYNTNELVYDDLSYDFIKSVRDQYIRSGTLTKKQVGALIKIAERIKHEGPKMKPKPCTVKPQVGYFGMNCRTGDFWFHNWDVKEGE